MNIEQSFKNEMKRFGSVLDFPWDDKLFYANWLAQTYYYVCHSTRLLALAASHFPVEQGSFHTRFLQHAREEKGHEKLAKQDLLNMGYKISDFPESSALSAFYQTQYYCIQHKSPTTFFGWILALEGLAVHHGRSLLEAVQKCPEKVSTKFIALHVDEDPDHIEKALQNVSTCTPKEIEAIVENMKLSIDLYLQFTEKCQVRQQQMPMAA